MRIPRTTKRDTVYRAPHRVIILARRIAITHYDRGCDRCGAAIMERPSVFLEYRHGRRPLHAAFDMRPDEMLDLLCDACFRVLTPGDIAARLLVVALNP